MRISESARRWTLVGAAVAVGGTVAASWHGGRAVADDGADDRIVLTFATVGDSRQDPSTFDPTTAPLSGQDKQWLQNTKAWSRIMRSIQQQHAKLLFFNGDMIMGYGRDDVPADTSTVSKIVKSDLVQAYTQYAFWRGMVATLMEQGTYVVPVPGNHEVQYKAGGKVALVANENAWRANMGDLILDTARFQSMFGETPTDADVGDTSSYDHYPSDQSQLSFSFDFGGSHFAVINTDPVGNDSHAPVNWLTQDLADAKARGDTHFFVFGHKPAFTYYYGKGTPLPTSPSGLDAVADLSGRDAFWALIEQYGATYFCGHEHIFNMVRPTADTGKAWQVMVGSGGSPFEAKPTDVTVSPTDRYYAWAKVDVFESGKVRITGYGFDENFGSLRYLKSVTLAH
jgi:hypothetical protein